MVDEEHLGAAMPGMPTMTSLQECELDSLRPAPGSSIMTTRGVPTMHRAISTMRRSLAPGRRPCVHVVD